MTPAPVTPHDPPTGVPGARLAGVVLAGGRSARLGGTDKAELRDERGRRLVETAVGTARDHGAAPVVVVGPDPGIPGVRMAREEPIFAGPAAALAAGVRALEAEAPEYVFVVACDMPGMSAALPLLLLAAEGSPPMPGAASARTPLPRSAGVTASSPGPEQSGAHESPDAWLARTTVDGRSRTQFLLGLYRFAPLLRATGGDLRDAPVRTILERLTVAEVEVPAAAADDADTWEDAARLGLHAPGRANKDAAADAHEGDPEWRMASALAHGQGGPAGTFDDLPLAEAIGEVVARDVASPIDVPHYASSAMDGFAVAGEPPWPLIEGSIAAGSGPAATRIVTGGLVPDGATGIIRGEYARVEAGSVHPAENCPPTEREPGRHIRAAGRELAAGGLVVPRGTTVTEAVLAFAAVAGLDYLPVIPRVSVDLLLTGSEVVTSGLPGPGRVRDVFGPQLPTLIARLGGRLGVATRIPDDARLTRDALADTTAEVLVTTGGTGHSHADHVRSTLRDVGAEFVVSGLRLRPGHPSILARLPSGTWVLGLPGNPLAAMTAMLVLGRPLLAGLRGRALPEVERVRLGSRIEGAPVERMVPVAPDADGRWAACDGIGPNMLRGLARATALASVPPGGADAGTHVDALRLPWA